VLAVFVLVPSNHGPGSSSSASNAASSAIAAPSSGVAGANAIAGAPHRASAGAASSSAEAGQAIAPAPTASSGATPQPPSNGRKSIQSAQLSLSTAPDRVDDVAQEAFDVVGQENGIVNRSSITQTGRSDGSAFMDLSVPSASVAQTMTKLSHLTNARVSSRTDTSQDVNNQYVQAKRRLSDARALRTSLLKQLAGATTTSQVDSLKARIRDAERSISADERALAGLNHRIAFSAITLSINATAQPVATSHHSGGFTLGSALHTAGRILMVAAGVLLIGIAVLIPLGALAGVAWWVGGTVTHRRRERALDLA
jgi:hypothetical protein